MLLFIFLIVVFLYFINYNLIKGGKKKCLNNITCLSNITKNSDITYKSKINL
jgi:hypothetical protein